LLGKGVKKPVYSLQFFAIKIARLSLPLRDSQGTGSWLQQLPSGQVVSVLVLYNLFRSFDLSSLSVHSGVTFTSESAIPQTSHILVLVISPCCQDWCLTSTKSVSEYHMLNNAEPLIMIYKGELISRTFPLKYCAAQAFALTPPPQSCQRVEITTHRGRVLRRCPKCRYTRIQAGYVIHKTSSITSTSSPLRSSA